MILLHDQTEEVDGDRDRQREGWPTPKGEKTPRPTNARRNNNDAAKNPSAASGEAKNPGNDCKESVA
jgi:small conductance mechanosensitive channel